MRQTRTLALLCSLLAVSGCHRFRSVPETPMPRNTILLSQMLRQEPGFSETLISQLGGGNSEQSKNKKTGPALLTPKLMDELRKRILGSDWQSLDRFPGWTMREINPAVRVIGHIAGKDQQLEADASVHPGASPSSAQKNDLLDIGPYTLDKTQTISLDQPSVLPSFTTEGIVSDLGHNVSRGDGPNDLASEHSESQRFADILNRLSVNKLDGAQKFFAELGAHKGKMASSGSSLSQAEDIDTPEKLIGALQSSGHTVTVQDARYFANFAHLHYKGEDVMAPFWINTGLRVPGTMRPLLVPVSHAEYEWHIRGPLLNADISWYFGVDGKAEFRTMDTLDQAWVLKRNAHTYTGKDAVEVTRLAGLFTLAYMHLHASHPAIPFGGYYAFGVCQDSVSAIEHHMTGTSTLFPNTADVAFFSDSRDAEINALIAAIPKDRDGAAPMPERIFGSLPVSPAADAEHAFDQITIPGLADDLNAAYAAWRQSTLRYLHPIRYGVFVTVAAILLLGAVVLLDRTRRRQRIQENKLR